MVTSKYELIVIVENVFLNVENFYGLKYRFAANGSSMPTPFLSVRDIPYSRIVSEVASKLLSISFCKLNVMKIRISMCRGSFPNV